ncbi:hypothetical protein E1287_30610 [Actinomadura sp. KC06]|uniref:hypothetical protein n=1 Tax=Actinomadura sp. KC06 TaxID=2530369 RepID=UPI00104A2466|nr:hypothetical protein [Actinomadura sp. KC06]TDD29635.1 hypothetical protein E1287_30610 [Actinomadura sp. KC06]
MSPLLRMVWDGEHVAGWRCRAAVRLAGAHLDHVTAGQTAVAVCGCGEPVAEYTGDWFHVLNPELRGTNDHWAEPTPGTVVRYRHWRPLDTLDPP